MQSLRRTRIQITLVAACILAAFLLAAFRFQTLSRDSLIFKNESAASASLPANMPPVILWAWERPEDLGFIDPHQTGVAFLAKTIYLRDDRVISRPRFQPLSTPPATSLIAVVRIETDRTETPTLSANQMKEVVAEISKTSSPDIRMVQIDFDARVTERQFYRELLAALREALPRSTSLSITALASWCKGDNWLDDLPIDEAVPMLFRMGLETRQFQSHVAAGEKFRSLKCQGSVGISTDEPLGKLPEAARIYVFNPKVWSASEVNQIMETYQR